MRKLNLVLAFSMLAPILHAQVATKWPHTLLWKISGNNLTQPSYLFGTLHLQDKRIFRFGDSLYSALERVEGCATEVDLQEFIDSLVRRTIQQEVHSSLEEEKNADKKTIDSLIRNVRLHKDKSSKKQLDKLRMSKINRLLGKEKMSTIVDAYLYSIARRYGKWVGGIEDIEDQLSLVNEVGATADSSDLLGTDAVLKRMLDNMVKMYVDGDLDKVEKFFIKNSSPKNPEDLVFTRRNIKMSRRMDSLMRIRTMFFAVGTAHLPGDSGVINLLRERGYRVAPVFYSQTVDPDSYANRLSTMPWIHVADEKKTYGVDMPGPASDLEILGDVFKLKLYFDITTLTFYMAGSTIFNSNVDLDELIARIAERTKGAEVAKKRKLDLAGMKGIEADINFPEGFYRIRFLVNNGIGYMLMAGGQDESVAKSGDLQKFFESFRSTAPPQTETSKSAKQWQAFVLPEKGVSIMMPGKPRPNQVLMDKARGTNWNFTVYDFTDLSAGLYLVVQVRDLHPGYFLSTDTSFFSEFRRNRFGLSKEAARDTLLTVQGFPALRYDAFSKEDNLYFATMNICRGNRIYTLMAASSNGKGDPQLEKYFNSVILTDYPPSEWKKQVAPGAEFSSLAPAPITLTQDTPDDDTDATKSEPVKYFLSFNPVSNISYQVFKQAFPKYYWVENDSSLYAAYERTYKGEDDSTLVSKPVTNGQLKGHEWVFKRPASNNLKKARILLNGDSAYLLLSFIPSQYINDAEQQKFFEEFRATRENTRPYVFESKAEQIFTDLLSGDSATFAEASEALSNSPFSKRDLPLVHDALLRKYSDDTSYYYHAHSRIIDVLHDLADSSTIDFISKNFEDHPGYQGDMLYILARHKTSYSFSTLKRLLLEHTPREGELHPGFSYALSDSVELASGLYPEILKLSSNPLFALTVIELCKHQLDHGAIDVNSLKPYEPDFIYTADTILAALKKSGNLDATYRYSELIDLLADFNDEKSNAMLQRYLSLDDSYVRSAVTINLLKNNQHVDPIQLEKLAADKAYRKDLFDSLSVMKKLHLFPARYKTQRMLAESELFELASDDEEPSSITFVAEKFIPVDGKKQRFLLFKVVFSNEDEASQYLGVAGPYSVDASKLVSEGPLSGVYWEEQFDAKKIDSYLRKFIELRKDSREE
jgi:uncharacterized protein YbaP (TraB family)